MTAIGAKKVKLKRVMAAFDSGPQDWAPLLSGKVPSLAKLALEFGVGDSVGDKAKTAATRFMYQEKHEDDRMIDAALAVGSIEDRTVESYLDKYGPVAEDYKKNGDGWITEQAGPALMPDFLRANSDEIEALARIQNALADADYLSSLLDEMMGKPHPGLETQGFTQDQHSVPSDTGSPVNPEDPVSSQ